MTRPTTRRPAGAGPKAPKNRPATNSQTPVVKGIRAARPPITRIRRLATLPPRAQIGPGHGVVHLITVALRLAGAGLLVWVGAIHLDLWLGGYRQIPTDGPLFLADAIAGFALAASLLAWPRPLVGLLGTGFMVSTLAGLILSINVGLFGFQESIRASFVVESILLESIGAVTLLAWTAILVLEPRAG
jgi:hypothetical protein